MKRVEICLKEGERVTLETLCSSGVWSLPLLTEVARQQSHLLSHVSQSTVRQTLKKNAVSLG